MPKCPKCGANSSDVRVVKCPVCGKVFCNKSGTQNGRSCCNVHGGSTAAGGTCPFCHKGKLQSY
ncbi:MAG: hypothetical protein IKA22_05780 [Lentisphaeria bacterium]|nr:hypothetical protein [Lentisphaeria bacterium]